MEFGERITVNTIATGDAAMTTIAGTIPTTATATTTGGAEYPGLTRDKRLASLFESSASFQLERVGRGFRLSGLDDRIAAWPERSTLFQLQSATWKILLIVP